MPAGWRHLAEGGTVPHQLVELVSPYLVAIAIAYTDKQLSQTHLT